MDYRFKRRESVRSGFRRIASEQCEEFRAHLTGGDAPDVHGARKCCKMLRALLRLFREEIGRAEFAGLDRDVSDLARRLGAARDAEVRRHTFERLLATRCAGDLRPFAAISRALDAEVRAVRRRALSKAALARCVREMAAIGERMQALHLQGRGWKVIEPGLRRAYAAARRPLRKKSTLTDEARHKWRKHIKTLWYHTRLLGGVRKGRMKYLADDLDTLGEVFGEDHDLSMLAAHLRDRLLRGAPTRVREPLFALIAEGRGELFHAARTRAAAVFGEKPRDFTDRIGKWWRDWHA